MLTRARSNESQTVNVTMRLQFSFSETQNLNYNLLRHRTSFSDHKHINNVTKFVTTSGNMGCSCLSSFSERKTVNFELQNSFLAVF